MRNTSVSAAEAVAVIPEGARIVVPPGPASPNALLAAVGDRTWSSPIELYCGAGRLPKSILENRDIRIFDWQFGPGARSLFLSGRVDYVPLRYSDFPRAFGREGALAADVLLMQIPSIDEGRVSPGLCGAIGFDVCDSVPIALAEVNHALPFTRSVREYRSSALDATVEVSEPLGHMPRQAASESELAVARNVASVVPDGATLQFGTGSVVEAVLSLLGDHQNLGIHSGMVTEGIWPLIQSGAINNARKGYLDGVTVSGMVAGSGSFLQFIERNDEFMVVPAAISHGVDILTKLQVFTTINSAIEVDLTGQVNAEYLGGSQFSGVGGQADYTFAGSTSPQPNCRSIIAMPATTADQSVSRIVPNLCHGAIVTTPRYCVDYVVTDWGVADLRFQPLRERAKRLIAVAHPAHREALERSLAESPGPR